MNSISEVGHAKNVANFEDLISYCSGYGATYNPNLTAIKIANLNTLKTSANTALTNVVTALTIFKNATNNREIVFLPIRKLSTRLMNALRASGVTEQTMKDALSINKKIQGKRSKALKESETESKKVVGPSIPVPIISVGSISVSQQSFDSLIEHFSKLIDLLSTVSAYNPNEADLKVTALNTLLASMKAVNTTVINATTSISNARITRNDILYKTMIGLVDVALEVKSYVKSVYGAASSQYKQVSKLTFKKLVK